MIWKKAKKCVVCGFNSKNGEKIHGRFMCYLCEMQMVESLATEQEEREYAEIQRVSSQRFSDDNRM